MDIFEFLTKSLSFRVAYNLVVTLESALRMFSIEVDGVEMGVVKVNFRS